jgi:hypothetical protein
MGKNIFNKAKEHVFSLVGYNGDVPLYMLTQDSCSEVSRLLGQWLRERFPKAKIYIYKGKAKGRSHDLLFIETDRVYVIDPTVWQFFKNKKSILIAAENSIDNAVSALAHYYGGKWKMSERVRGYSAAQIKKFKDIVKKNQQ